MKEKQLKMQLKNERNKGQEKVTTAHGRYKPRHSQGL